MMKQTESMSGKTILAMMEMLEQQFLKSKTENQKLAQLVNHQKQTIAELNQQIEQLQQPHTVETSHVVESFEDIPMEVLDTKKTEEEPILRSVHFLRPEGGGIAWEEEKQTTTYHDSIIPHDDPLIQIPSVSPQPKSTFQKLIGLQKRFAKRRHKVGTLLVGNASFESSQSPVF